VDVFHEQGKKRFSPGKESPIVYFPLTTKKLLVLTQNKKYTGSYFNASRDMALVDQ